MLYPVFLMQALCFALFACAFNLLIGYVACFRSAMPCFLAGRAIVGTRRQALGLPAGGGGLFATAGAAGLGVVAGVIAIRRQGIYFAMITLALAQMMFFVALRAPFTAARTAFRRFRADACSGCSTCPANDMYVFILVVVLAAFLFIYRIVNSPFGEVLKAIRENEVRAISLGYKTDRYKLLAFILSATLAGLAGALKALVVHLASLTDVYWTMSGEVVLMTLVGGLGTLFGPVVGAFLIVALENYLASFGQWVLVIQGSIFVVCVLAFRRGIVGELGNALRIKL